MFDDKDPPKLNKRIKFLMQKDTLLLNFSKKTEVMSKLLINLKILVIVWHYWSKLQNKIIIPESVNIC